ncbi:YrzE family protein [Methanobacterium petrolearium]|uniref:YrzE family protein n=1 Tax=Methanobacterium petrolearium TaxID=710190 RepID=UPI001AE76F69|nr:YrzE family protein [Methanobacterium petrolearium]MBP1945086.1 rRNA maturation protein Nop10 [Methanobacterium petrolearium]BDZ71006.1 hypothetical protein GCM10025861_15230 [Methanobacterium petrolearium]
MSYLVCDQCGGYYELHENESPDDFESCECGGNLKEVENLKNLWQCINVECDYKEYGEKDDTCPKCGKSFYKVDIDESRRIFTLKNKCKADPDYLNKNKRFNTVGAIIIAYLVTGFLIFLLRFIPDILLGNVLTIFITIFGGFVATYLAKSNEPIIGLYYGLVDLVGRIHLIIIFKFQYTFLFILFLILIPVFGLFGGYLEKMLSSRLKKR